MKKILMVLEAGDALPSGMVRGLIYKDLFAKRGYAVRYINRIPPALVRAAAKFKLFGSRNKSGKAGGWFKKFLSILYFFLDWRIAAAAGGFDVVYLSKVRSHRLIGRLRKKTRARLVYDFGDAIWLAGRPSNQWFEPEHFEEILRGVDAVTTDNEFTAAYAGKFNSAVTVVADYPQTELFDAQRSLRRDGRDSSKITIGWLGSPSTVYNLYAVWEALEAVFLKHKNITLRLVGTGGDPGLLPQFENVAYSALAQYNQSQMVQEVLAMDIGIFPLQDTEASRVRGVLKAAVYMSGACAVVASPVGQCQSFIQEGINGFLAKDTAEWTQKLDALICDGALRGRLAQAGLRSVRENFSLRSSFDALLAALEGPSCGVKS